MATPRNADELAMQSSALYREDVFTDRRVGVIRVLTPVTADGMMDATRRMVYAGETQLFTGAGVLPLAFEIDAGSLAAAIAKFGPSAKAAVERAAEELQELRRTRPPRSDQAVVSHRPPTDRRGTRVPLRGVAEA